MGTYVNTAYQPYTNYNQTYQTNYSSIDTGLFSNIHSFYNNFSPVISQGQYAGMAPQQFAQPVQQQNNSSAFLQQLILLLLSALLRPT